MSLIHFSFSESAYQKDMEITKIRGINEKRQNELNKMGIFDTADLIRHFPRAYLDLREKQYLKYAYHNDIILEVCDHYGLQYQNPTLFFLQSNSNDHACIVRDCNTYSTCSLGLLFYNHKRLLFTSKNKKGRCLKKFSDIAQII